MSALYVKESSIVSQTSNLIPFPSRNQSPHLPQSASEPPVMDSSPSSLIPSKALPWLAGIVGLAGVGLTVLPEHTIAFKVCAGIMGVGVVLGIASPGMVRKKQ